jgi:hypothetical protein
MKRSMGDKADLSISRDWALAKSTRDKKNEAMRQMQRA